MRKFGAGLLIGLSIGFAATASAAQIVGSTSYLFGWEVEKDGETICTDPFIWKETMQIECD